MAEVRTVAGEPDEQLDPKQTKQQLADARAEVERILQATYDADEKIAKAKERKAKLSEDLAAALEVQAQAERAHADAQGIAGGEPVTVAVGQAKATDRSRARG